MLHSECAFTLLCLKLNGVCPSSCIFFHRTNLSMSIYPPTQAQAYYARRKTRTSAEKRGFKSRVSEHVNGNGEPSAYVQKEERLLM